MVAIWSSETWGSHRTTRRHNPEGGSYEIMTPVAIKSRIPTFRRAMLSPSSCFKCVSSGIEIPQGNWSYDKGQRVKILSRLELYEKRITERPLHWEIRRHKWGGSNHERDLTVPGIPCWFSGESRITWKVDRNGSMTISVTCLHNQGNSWTYTSHWRQRQCSSETSQSATKQYGIRTQNDTLRNLQV